MRWYTFYFQLLFPLHSYFRWSTFLFGPLIDNKMGSIHNVKVEPDLEIYDGPVEHVIKVEPKRELEAPANDNQSEILISGVRSERAPSGWSQKALGKSKNVVETILIRQLGLPFFGRSGDTLSNASNEVNMGRHLLKRSPEDQGVAVTPKKLKLEVNRDKLQIFPDKWIKLETKPEKTDVKLDTLVDPAALQVGIAGDKFWVSLKQGGRNNIRTKETFHVLEPQNFASVGKAGFQGKCKKTALLSIRSLSSNPTSTYLLTLSEPNNLRAYDLIKGKVSNELTLSLNIVPGHLIKYTELNFYEEEAKLFVMATSKGGKGRDLRAILIFDFPPIMTKVGIIYVEELELKISICDGLCYILQGSDSKPILKLTTWPFVMKNVQKIPPSGRTPSSSLSVQFEGRLRTMPTILNTIQLQMNDFDLLNTPIPLLYAAVNSEIKFFLPVHLDQAPQESLYTYQVPGIGEDTDVFGLPDDSPRALITTRRGGHQVVSFTATPNELGVKQMQVKVTHPFNYWDEIKAQREAIPSTASTPASSRPSRACVTNSKLKMKEILNPDKKSILGIQYCGALDLIGVLIADEEEFIVVLYDSQSLKVFKPLPPVKAWPAGKGGGANKKREEIVNVDFAFEIDFIFVNFGYKDNSKAELDDMFIFRLMTESFD